MNNKKLCKINRYEAILIISLQDEISRKSARDKLNFLNKNYNFPKQNGDQININNITGEYENSSSYVDEFYRTKELIIEESKENKENSYYIELTEEEFLIRESIHSLTTINKKIFDGEHTIFGSVKKKIENKLSFPKIKTDLKLNREDVFDKKNTAANKMVFDNNLGQWIGLNYERFTYEDFFEFNTLKSEKEIELSIRKKVQEIKGLHLFIMEDHEFIEKIVNTIKDIVINESNLKVMILNKLTFTTDIDKLKKIADILI